MSVVRIKGLQRFRDNRDGKWYCYHRKSGKRLRSEYGSPAFFAELAKIDAETKQAEKEAGKPKTFGELAAKYLGSSWYSRLAPRTKSDYAKEIDGLKHLYEMPLAQITRPFMAELRDLIEKERSWHKANATLAVMSMIFKLGTEHGCMTENPCFRLTKARRPESDEDGEEANRPWTDEERRVVLSAIPPHIRLPVAIGMWTGLREADVLKLPRTACAGGWLRHKTGKSRKRTEVVLPIFPDFQEELTRAPDHDAITLCANSRGRPWTESGFRCSFFKELKRLEAAGKIAPGLTFHGLRHTVGGELAEHGVSAQAIALWLGQKTTAMAEHYSRRANKKKRMEATVTTIRKGGGTST